MRTGDCSGMLPRSTDWIRQSKRGGCSLPKNAWAIAKTRLTWGMLSQIKTNNVRVSSDPSKTGTHCLKRGKSKLMLMGKWLVVGRIQRGRGKGKPIKSLFSHKNNEDSRPTQLHWWVQPANKSRSPLEFIQCGTFRQRCQKAFWEVQFGYALLCMISFAEMSNWWAKSDSC